MGKNALVLGGGGSLGVAWETGMLVGLAEARVDVTHADLIVGTSAGAIVGTYLAAGQTLDELLARQMEPDDGTTASLMAEIDPAGTMQLFRRWAGITEVTPKIRAEIGALAVSAKTASEARWTDWFRREFDGIGWPERPLILTAVDCGDGSFQQWDRTSAVELALAIASSCAVPGLFPAVTINGRRYTDGGLRSGTNADLAAVYDAVIIVAPIGARSDGIDPVLGRQARSEAEALRSAGSRVELAFPDAASLEAIGPSRMDASRRSLAAEAGIVQGKALGSNLTADWTKIAA